MEEWKIYKIGDLFSHFKSGKGIKADEITPKGDYPVFGGNGLRGYTSRYNFEGDCAIIGRQGAFCGNVRYFKGKAYMTEHAIIAVANDNNNTRFLAYLLGVMKLGRFSGQSAQPGLAVSELAKQLISVPALSLQNKIASILSSLDDKIELNRRLNDNLEQQATSLFESWFVNHDPWNGVRPPDWINAPLGSFVEIKRGGSPRPIQYYLSDSGLRWLKISDVTSLSSPFVREIKEYIKEDGLRKTVFLHAGELVLSNSATPGIPKILDVDTCIHDGWLYFPKSELSKYYLYLFFKYIRKELIALSNGSVFNNLKTDILKAFPVTKASETILKEFDTLVIPLFDAMLNADRENFKLVAMRDALLPKLMSGEIDVSNIQI
ncbi:restriction endonuclease subunit S [Akkermansia muciniphila]|uniref:restriction endonuclease subunit S n=1 Tax=Akkermansia muciniphila TaxID=239935 RepID=UPI0015E09BAE|nr:restriction endonuclease subunit S [Akkermansia muciniphila]